MVLPDVSTCIRMGGSGQSVELLLEGDCVTAQITLNEASNYARLEYASYNGLNNMERNLTKNFIFRWFECGLNKEETAKLCFVSVTEVTLWDEGKKIPDVCKRVMRMAAGRELPSIFERYWEGWRMSGYHLITPAGSQMTRQRLELIDIMGAEHYKRWQSPRKKYRFYR